MKRMAITATWNSGFPSVEIQVNDDFKLDHIKVSVDAPGNTQIDDILLDGESMLVGSIDAYVFSIKEEEKLIKEFKKQHKLEEKNEKELLKYLEKEEISMPDPCYIPFHKIIMKGGIITIVGTTSVDVQIMVTGLAR